MKKIKKIYGLKILKKLGIAGIAISNFILFADKFPSQRLERHEKAHVMQYRRMSLFNQTWIGFVIFLLRYGFEFLFGLICYRSWWTAHERISFEYEARIYECASEFENIKYIQFGGENEKI